MPPVDDHPVHDRTRIKAGFKYGCFDKPRVAIGYIAFDRQYREDGTFVIVQKFISNEMSKPCRSFYLWDTDPYCAGCDTPKDHEYANKMREMK